MSAMGGLLYHHPFLAEDMGLHLYFLYTCVYEDADAGVGEGLDLGDAQVARSLVDADLNAFSKFVPLNVGLKGFSFIEASVVANVPDAVRMNRGSRGSSSRQRRIVRTAWLSAPSETTTSAQTRSKISCRVTTR